MEIPSEQWKYFVDVGVWPKKTIFSPNNWIKNFSKEELPFAIRLLEGFTYFSEEMVKQMFRSSFLQISKFLVEHKNNRLLANNEWCDFINSVYIVRVTGEEPSDTDSGYLFSRYSRDILGIPENQIISPEKALSLLTKNQSGSIVFVDDFVGSGNQFVETWHRKYVIDNSFVSFDDVARHAGGKIKFFYCPVICTDKGKINIENECSAIKLIASHYYGEFHSALNPESFIWRDDMKTEGPDFVMQASQRAGIPYLYGGVGCWTGFNSLGLALGFSHGWPDATLPLFYSEAHNWRPLLSKGVL